jgi:hypothetical protein
MNLKGGFNEKTGLNLVKVMVKRFNDWNSLPKACAWLGLTRFKCGNCKLGYFSVYDFNQYDRQCPECKFDVIVRWHDDDYRGEPDAFETF